MIFSASQVQKKCHEHVWIFIILVYVDCTKDLIQLIMVVFGRS